MAKDFSSNEAKKVIERHSFLLSSLRNTIRLYEGMKEAVSKAADGYVAQESMTVLRGIPVSEINREKNGIRIKPLMDENFTTMADLYVASVANLAAVHGIGEETARTIKQLAGSYAEKTKKEIKIKLTADKKDKYSTELVRAISVYKNSFPHLQKCDELYWGHSATIKQAVADLKPATGGLKWIFASKAAKEKAARAYTYLKELLDGSYQTEVRSHVSSVKKFAQTDEKEAWSDFTANNVAFYNVLEEFRPGLLGTDDALFGLPEDLAREIQDECIFPNGLKCTLRRYQECGVKYILHQERVLLGDEMGLGKTVQAIAAMVSLKNTGATHFVVVCPASVVANWCREIAKHSLLRVTKVHGSGRKNALKAWIETGGVAVTTFDVASDFALESDFKFSLLIVDEAHYIKNPEAKRTMSTKELCGHAERLLFMTGTALENKVDEMVSLISILKPELAKQVSSVAFMSSAPQFRDKIAPVYYRRKREDVLTELPDLIDTKEWCSMTKEEERSYEHAVLKGRYADARRVSWDIGDLERSSKATRLKEIVEEAEEDGRKVIVFSFFLETIRKISRFLGQRCLEPIHGSVSPVRRQKIIDEFDKAPAGSVLLAQIQSGGTGLNIQSASVVVLCEPQLKPSIENQAISRAYRMGQARNVLVYRLLSEDSIDEKITELLEEKQAIFDAFADKSVSAEKTLEIDGTSFGDIILEEIERIKRKNSDKGAPETRRELSAFRRKSKRKD